MKTNDIKTIEWVGLTLMEIAMSKKGIQNANITKNGEVVIIDGGNNMGNDKQIAKAFFSCVKKRGKGRKYRSKMA